MAQLRTQTLLIQTKLGLMDKNCNTQSLFSKILLIATSLDERISKLEKDLVKSQGKDTDKFEDTKNALKHLTDNIKEIESSIKEMGSKNTLLEQNYEEMQITVETVEENCLRYKKEMQTGISSQHQAIQIDQIRKLQNYVTEMRCHSMKNNLIFSGLPYKTNEDCEETVRNFLCNEMGINHRVELENVHRFGNPGPAGVKPIVAHFLYRKDLEFILKNGYRLKGKFYSVNEQFPLEIEKRRKQLYPIFKQAKQEKKKVKLVRDKLYINNCLYNPFQESLIKERMLDSAPTKGETELHSIEFTFRENIEYIK